MSSQGHLPPKRAGLDDDHSAPSASGVGVLASSGLSTRPAASPAAPPADVVAANTLPCPTTASAGLAPPAAAVAAAPPLTAAAFLEAPVHVAREWLAAQPEDDGKLHVFDKPDVVQVFSRMVDYVARLQLALQRTVEPNHGQLLEARAMNTLLLGVKGVGKTALVRGVVDFTNALAAADPTFGVLGIYIDCSKPGLQLPRDSMIAALLGRMDEGGLQIQLPNAPAVVREGHRMGVSFFLAFDELQSIYVPEAKDAAKYNWARLFVDDLYELGKNCSNVATVLTGSSKRTEHYVYRDPGHDAILENMCDTYAAAASGHQDLNNTVFEASRIFPLREKTQIAAVFPDADDAALARRFFWSGGAERQLRIGMGKAVTALPNDVPQRDAVLHLLWLNGLLTLDAATGTMAVNEARVAELQADPWSLRWEQRLEVIRILQGTSSAEEPGMLARGLLGLMEDASLLYTKGMRTTFFRPCDAVAWAQIAAEELSSSSDYVTRLCHMLLAGKCDGSGSLGHRVEPDMLRYAGSKVGGLHDDSPVEWTADKLRRHDSTLYFHDAPLGRLEQLPFGTVMGMVSERWQDGLWLEAMDDSVAVHLVQVKAGGRDMELGCGKEGGVSYDTLASIAWRMLHRAWPELQKLLSFAAATSGRTLHLGTLTLLTTKKVDAEHAGKFKNLVMTTPWFVVDGQRRSMRIVNDLSLVVRPESRGFYV